MMRMIIITLLNILLPFLIRFLYLALKRYLVRRFNKKYAATKAEPQWSYPWRLFLIIACALTLLFIIVERMFFFEPDKGFEHHIPKSEVLYK